MSKEENLKIYEAVRKPPQEALRQIEAGRLKGKTDISPVWRIKTLTEQFGPCGKGWYTQTLKKWIERNENTGEACAYVDLLLYVKFDPDGEWSAPIEGTGGAMFIANEKNGPFTDDEAFKKAHTDAISVACKMLGFAADVYWQKDPTKYTSGANTPPPNGAGKGAQTKGSAQGGTTTPPSAENAPQSAKTWSSAGTQIVDGIDIMDDIAYNAALIQMCEGTGITWEQLRLISKRDLKVDVNQQSMDQRNQFYKTVKEHTDKLKGGKA